MLRHHLKLIAVAVVAVTAFTLQSVNTADAATVRQEVDSSISFGFGGRDTSYDIDGDGTDDVNLKGYYYSYYSRSGSGSSTSLSISGLNGTQVARGAPLSEADPVDASLTFADSVSIAGVYSNYRRNCGWRGCRSSSTSGYSGDWSINADGPIQGFLGLKLSGDRFAWLELDINHRGNGKLVAFGYETAGNTEIKAGAETSLVVTPLPASSFLLLGGLGLIAGFSKRKQRPV